MLIILYQQKELLYNAQHPDYTNREKRLHAYDEITERLRYMRKTITTEEVKAKIELLRRQFLVELNKIQSAYYSGRSAPSVWWFNSMKFIQSHLKRRNTDGVEATTPEEECEPEPEPEYVSWPQGVLLHFLFYLSPIKVISPTSTVELLTSIEFSSK